jgi:hypothetical protein
MPKGRQPRHFAPKNHTFHSGNHLATGVVQSLSVDSVFEPDRVAPCIISSAATMLKKINSLLTMRSHHYNLQKVLHLFDRK